MKQQGTCIRSSDILQSKFTNPESWRSVAMSWALYALSQNKHVQTKLREEICNISTDHPTMDELNGLPYMDAVVREVLRLHPPVTRILREARKDDCIPLSQPFTDKKGIVHNEIR
jgi:Cytochrome P450